MTVVLTCAPDLTLTVTLAGEIDMAAVPALELVLGALSAPAWGPVRVDLRDVTFIDCAGMRPLLRLRRARGDQAHLIAVPWCAERLFRLTGVHDYLLRPAPARLVAQPPADASCVRPASATGVA